MESTNKLRCFFNKTRLCNKRYGACAQYRNCDSLSFLANSAVRNWKWPKTDRARGYLFLLLAPNAYIETARAISQYLVLPMHKLFRTQLHFENQPHSSSTRAWSTCYSKINERWRQHNKNCFLARSHAQPRVVAPNAASLANYVLWLGLNFGAALAEARCEISDFAPGRCFRRHTDIYRS